MVRKYVSGKKGLVYLKSNFKGRAVRAAGTFHGRDTALGQDYQRKGDALKWTSG